MKIDRAALRRPCTAELLPKCAELIEELKTLDDAAFIARLASISDWHTGFGKTELARWADVLDKCDVVLEKAAQSRTSGSHQLMIDSLDAVALRNATIVVLKFTALLFENTFTRSMYSSADRLLALLDAGNIEVVTEVLRLFYVMSKRSRFLSQQLSESDQKRLTTRLSSIAESWGGRFRNLTLSDCCTPGVKLGSVLPISYQTAEGTKLIESVESSKSAGQYMDEILARETLEDLEKAALFARLRLACSFQNPTDRMHCVEARLVSISTLVYSRSLQEEAQVNALLYPGFIEEVVSVLKLSGARPFDVIDVIKTEALRTLTSIVFLDRAPKLHLVVEALEASSYHGFVARLTRTCVDALQRGRLASTINDDPDLISVPFCTALFSFLYHLAGYDNGGEALVACGLTETLLNVVATHELPIEHISFVTRSVRVIDIVTALDVTSFHAASGMQTTINRLVHEVEECRRQQPYEIVPRPTAPVPEAAVEESMDTGNPAVDSDADQAGPSRAGLSSQMSVDSVDIPSEPLPNRRCHQQRAALIKSLLNFIKRAIQDSHFADAVRHIMDGPLPGVLKHLVSNPDYYGPSLFQNAIHVTTNFIYQEPSQLTSLQEKGLTHVILEALLGKEVPATREILSSLPTTFTALCLNERGLQAFVSCRPFERLFKVLLSTKYLQAMKRKRNEMNDTAMALGSALDDLMRHQPTLRPDVMNAIVQLLDQIIDYGTKEKYKCVMTWSSKLASSQASVEALANNGVTHQSSNDSSDEEEDGDDDGDSRPVPIAEVSQSPQALPPSMPTAVTTATKSVIPLGEYLQNTMKFLETVITQNASPDHAQAFVAAGGIERLVKVTALPNMPVEFAQSTVCQTIATIMRFLVQQTRNSSVLDALIKQTMDAVTPLAEAITRPVGPNGGSRLIQEVLDSDSGAPQAELPILRQFATVQCQAQVLAQIAKTALGSNTELKASIIRRWIEPEMGMTLLARLHELYRSLVWESTVMLALCSSSSSLNGSAFGAEQVEALKKMVAAHGSKTESKSQPMEVDERTSSSTTADPLAAQSTTVARENSTTNSTLDATSTGSGANAGGAEGAQFPTPSPLLTELKPLISSTSRTYRYLSDLFLTLAKTCLGGSSRSRRGHAPPLHLPPTPDALRLADLLFDGCRRAFEWRPTGATPPRKLCLSYVVCVTTFINPLLFDDRRQPYLVMLSKFYHSGCHNAFISCLSDELNGEPADSDSNDGVEDVLEAWLLLVERLVNANSLMNTPHKIGIDCEEAAKFDVRKYLMKCHRDVFDQLERVFRFMPKTKSVRVSELAMSVYQEILKGMSLLRKETTEEEKKPTKPWPDERRELEQEMDPQQIRALTDMGFPRDLVVDALIECGSVAEATEFLISGAAARRPGHQVPLTEEEQMERAIAMSLQQPDDAALVDLTQSVGDAAAQTSSTAAGDAPSSSSAPSAAPDTNTNASQAASTSGSRIPPLSEASLMSDEQVRTMTERCVVPLCLRLMDNSPELVYRTADLLSVVVDHLGPDWMRGALVDDLLVGQTRNMARNVLSSPVTDVESLAKSLSTRLHLLCLMFEELGPSCLKAAVDADMVAIVIDLLHTCVANSALEYFAKLITPALLWLDLADKVATLLKRKSAVDKLCDAFTWRYWEQHDRTGLGSRWIPYSPAANRSLNEAFKAGKTCCQLTIGGREYLINFVDMSQINIESNVKRAVVVLPKAKEKEKDKEKATTSAAMAEDAVIAAEYHLSAEQSARVIVLMVRILESKNVDADALQAAMRLCLRLTRHAALASDFVQQGGLRALFHLKKTDRPFPTASILAALLIRNCLEDEQTLKHTVEKVIRAVASGAHGTNRWDARGERQIREFYFAMRTLAPLASRNADVFLSVAKQILRFGADAQEGNDRRQLNLEPATSEYSTVLPNSPSAGVKEVLSLVFSRAIDSSAAHNDALITRSVLLRLLAELVRSYSSVAIFIAEHREPNADASALASLIDHSLVPEDAKDQEQVDCASAVRTLVATLASSNHSPKAQEALVSEVKTALYKAFATADPVRKRKKIAAIASLIFLMRDSCPTLAINGQQAPKQPSVHSNSMLRLFYKKRICLDLAKAPWFMDLSDKDSIDAVNQLLKTLEELTRTINAPYVQPVPPATGAPATASRAAQSTSDTAAGRLQQQSSRHDPPVAMSTSATVVASDAFSTSLSTREPSTARAVAAAQSSGSNASEDTSNQRMPPVPPQRMTSTEQQQQAQQVAAAESHERAAIVDADHDQFFSRAHLDAVPVSDEDSVSSSSSSPIGEDDDDDDDDDDVSTSDEDDDNEPEEETDVSQEDMDAHEAGHDEMEGIDDDGPGNEAGSERSEDEDEYGTIEVDEEMEARAAEEDDLESVGELGDAPLMGASVILEQMENMDDMDGFGLGGGTRLFGAPQDDMRLPWSAIYRRLVVQTTGGGQLTEMPAIVDRMLNGAADGVDVVALNAAGMAGVAEHPMLQRSRHVPIAGALVPQPGGAASAVGRLQEMLVPFANGGANARILLGGAQAGVGNYRFVFGTSRHHHRGFGGLHRQGAVRRWHHLPLDNNNDIFQRILEGNAGQHLFETFVGRHQRLNGPDYDTFDELREDGAFGAERRGVVASVPSALSRWSDEARMLDGVGVQYLMIPLRQELFAFLEDLRSKQAEKDRKEREVAEQKRKKEAKAKAKENEQSSIAAVDLAGQAPTASIAEAVVDEAPPAEQPLLQREEVVVEETPPAVDFIEPMDTTSPPADHSAETMQQNEPIPDSAQQQAEADAHHEPIADVAQQNEPPHEALRQDEPNAAPEQQQQQAADVAATSQEDPAEIARREQEAAALVAHQQEIENYRHILGDIEVPLGVDPAFLAALPDDMRAEVIQDHLRQQRVQQLRQDQQRRQQLQSGSTTGQPDGAAASSGRQEDAAAGASGVEVPGLDREFLDALPPELQEEILAQHEQARRAAEAAALGAREPEPADPAALIESLPPSLRAQVLADADDTVLQVLPSNVAAEARRLRATLEHQHMMRFASMLGPNAGMRANIAGGRYRQLAGNRNAVGAMAGLSAQAVAPGLQLLDKETLAGLLVLFFVDNTRLNTGRLQKILRSLCSHPPTCDYLIWALFAVFERLSLKEEQQMPSAGGQGWLDSLTVCTGLGSRQRVFMIGKAGRSVKIHPLVASSVCRQVLDTLISLAKAFPGQFLPAALRANANAIADAKAKDKDKDSKEPVEPLDSMEFWQLVAKLNTSRDALAPSASLSRVKQQGSMFALNEESTCDSLESAPLGRLMDQLDHPVVRETGSLQDRLLRLLSQVVMTLPDDTSQRIVGGKPARDPSDPHLVKQLSTVVGVITEGECNDEGLNDGRVLLMEAVRALGSATGHSVYELLFAAAVRLGRKLLPQIRRLLEELCSVAVADDASSTSLTREQALKGVAQNRFDGSSIVIQGQSSARLGAVAGNCQELQLPAVRALTDKFAAQHLLLRTLQSIIRMRETMKQRKAAKAAALQLAEQQRTAAAALASGIAVDPAASADADQSSPPIVPPESDANKSPVEDRLEESPLSDLLAELDPLWDALSDALARLSDASDPHAVLVLQPAAEAFFLVHASETKKEPTAEEQQLQLQQQISQQPASPLPGDAMSSSMSLLREGSVMGTLPPDTQKLVHFAEKHRRVLNQVLRQSNNSLVDGPFAILTEFPKLLDFDVKRRYFRKEIQRQDERMRREDVAVRVRRSHLFSDSFRELFRLRGPEWKSRFYIIFEGEEGQDAGGLLREWFAVITRDIFNPNYALFITAPGDRVTYMINKASHINPEHLEYFKFVGRLIAKAIYDNKLLDCYFTRAFYKHILNLPVRYQDMESEDPSFYKSLEFLLNNPIEDLGTELTFSLEVEEFGVRGMRELKPGGSQLLVTDENKHEYVKLVCQMKMTGSIRRQLDAFLEGFYELIPKRLISIFNEQELELLISGLPSVDIDDLQANTEYRSYTKTSPQIQWFWRALRSFEQEDRAKFLQFVTGTSKVPLQGFASLEGMNGVQKFSIHMDSRSTDRLPAAHTCFNQIDLPQYESYDKLCKMLLMAVRECTEGFGFA